ncbi:hypothetical protein NPIL_173021, partial [Nephila pilipes]
MLRHYETTAFLALSPLAAYARMNQYRFIVCELGNNQVPIISSLFKDNGSFTTKVPIQDKQKLGAKTNLPYIRHPTRGLIETFVATRPRPRPLGYRHRIYCWDSRLIAMLSQIAKRRMISWSEILKINQ